MKLSMVTATLYNLGMTKDSKLRLRRGIVFCKGKKIAEVDYRMNDSDMPIISDLSALPTTPESLKLKMDDGRILEFQVHEGAMIAHGLPLGPNESRYIY
jgi:hypothetical protein